MKYSISEEEEGEEEERRTQLLTTINVYLLSELHSEYAQHTVRNTPVLYAVKHTCNQKQSSLKPIILH